MANIQARTFNRGFFTVTTQKIKPKIEGIENESNFRAA